MPFMTGNSRISAGIESAIQFTRGMARTSGPRGRVPAFVLLAAAVMATVVGPAAAQDLTSGTAVYGTGQAATDWTGGTISSGATLRLNDGATVSGVAITNGTLQFNQTGALTINQSIDSTGRLSLTNSGTLNLTQTTSLNAPIQLLMTTDVSAGLLQINSGTVGLVVSGNGTLNVAGGNVSNAQGNINSGFATVSSGTWANGGALIVGNAGRGEFSLSGGSASNTGATLGTVATGSGTAPVSGGTWASSANLVVGRAGRGTLNVAGGHVSNVNGTLGQSNGGSGTATVSSGTWANRGNLVVGGTGTGVLTMTGGLVSVGGDLTRGSLGTINLNAGGTLQIGNGTTSGVLLGGTGDLANNGTLVFNRSDASTYSGILSGNGAVVKQGSGALTLSGANTYSVATTVSAGTLLVNGSLANSAVIVGSGRTLGGSGTLGALATVQSGGVLSPGNSPGALAAAALDLQAGSTTFMQVIGSGSAAGVAGTAYDQMRITTPSSLTYGGELVLSFIDSPLFDNGTMFSLFYFTGTAGGGFTSVRAAAGSSAVRG